MSKREVFVSLNIDLKGAETLAPLVQRQRELKEETKATQKTFKLLAEQLAKN